MGNRTIRILTAGLLAAGLGLSALPGQISDELGTVLRVRSSVKVRDLAGERALKKTGEAVRLGQTIWTGKTGALDLQFDGDGRLMLWRRTKVVLHEPGPRSDLHSDCKRAVAARIELMQGDLQVDHDSNRDAATLLPRVLEIETRDSFICLFGTSIQVHVDPNPDLGTGIYVRQTGAQVRHLSDKSGWVKLEASQQTFVREGEALRVQKVPRFTLPEQRGEGRFLDSPLFDPIVF